MTPVMHSRNTIPVQSQYCPLTRTRFFPPAVLASAAVLVWLSLTSGCGRGQPAPDLSGQTAFRVRTGFHAALNADHGWAGALNENVTIYADQPFRVRFEVETGPQLGGMPFRLQARRNAAEWAYVEAHDFPYPIRELDLEFEEMPVGRTLAGWSVEQGNTAGVVVSQMNERRKLLRIQAGQQPLIVVHSPPWEVTELTAEIQLFPGNQTGAGFVFAYTDPQNFSRVFLDASSGTIRVSQILNGAESVVAEENASISTDQWVSLEIDLENEWVEINFENDTLEFATEMGTSTPSSKIGFFLPSGGVANFRDIAIAGEARTPPISIVSSPGFINGEATTNLLTASTTPFQPGAGVALSGQTPPWSGGKGHSEFEWALVVRRFTDGAIINQEGDRFELKMVAADGRPLNSKENPTLRLTIPPGHLGGTFVETPGRIGPWKASSGDLYFIMEPTETDNLFMMVKSTDMGMTWREVDATNRPETNDLEAVDARQLGDTIHMLHQVTESTRLHAFRTSDHPTQPDTWALTDELAAVADSMAQAASLVVRSDGSMVAFYVGQTLHYNIRSAEGAWGHQVIIDQDALAAAGPRAVVGTDDTVHLAYYRADGTLWYRRLLADGTLTGAQFLASGAGTSRAVYGAVLPLVYMPETGTVVVIYRLADGYLWERRIDKSATLTEPVKASDRPVVTDAVDSQQAGADAVLDEQTVRVLFIDEETRSIFSTHDRGGWQPARLQIEDILGSWVRGNIHTRPDGVRVYGFVYDAGSNGGAGMNRYGEMELTDP